MATPWRRWHDRVRADAKRLALRAYEGSLVGPDLADAIVDLVQRASAHHGEETGTDSAPDQPSVQ